LDGGSRMTMTAPRTISLGSFCARRARLPRPLKCSPRCAPSRAKHLPRPPAKNTPTVRRSNEAVLDHRTGDSFIRPRYFTVGSTHGIGPGCDADPRGTLRSGVYQV